MDRVVGLERELDALRQQEARRREEWQVSQRLEAVGQLAAGVAHEINTPTQYVMDNTRFFGEAFQDLLGVLSAYDALLEAVREGGETEAAVEAVAKARKQADLAFLLEEVPQALEQSMEGLRQVASIVRAMKDFSHMGEKTFTPTDLGPLVETCLLYTSPSPRDGLLSRMPSSA